ncbi:TetR family transcriptional regulator [Streptomyces iconiensis]|uniref:TetR family transcriptional regulator n=1 Tax=Streptomyces iconiensis TaxID=1384038 RepID=A0ABT6ZZA5_9ACTN|nr:TetR family transcriptional regulator [Streptomyces iconiensis]MDJ1134139.1 TetR family transcriptional regulator [Streptomyces iconiensis]
MTDSPAPRPEPADAARTPRRAPAPGTRKLDAERSRRLLLEAANDEFAAKGFAGARVQDIADRAGLNKQLIAYYFGGKEGLWNALSRQWLEREKAFNDPEVPLDELMVRYLRAALDDPRGPRLNVWAGLTGTAPEQEREDLSDLRRRQSAGEIGDDLDPAAMLLLLTGAVVGPVVMPHTVRAIFGLDPESAEFQEHYAEQLRRVVRRLA